MSPEQLRGAPVDARTDVYSLAIIVFEALTGQLPFRARDPAGYARKHLEEAPPPMAVVNANAKVPPALEAAVVQALSKDPDGRPASAQAFAERLEAGLRGEAPAGFVPPVSAVPAVASESPAASRSGGSAIFVAVGLALAALGAAIAYVILAGG
jgi:serine/threonine-protein kinase